MKTKRSSENLETGFQTTFLFCMALLVINRILSGVVNWGFCADKVHAKFPDKYCDATLVVRLSLSEIFSIT
ncbi:hypothetical protein HMPREF3156_00254 [Neisseria sp. HMSC06F02]|nr:hypothetical protein HMPREF3156_00254 [Neisseria sp. HMSC06F02]